MGVVYLTIDGVMRLHVIALENGGGMDGDPLLSGGLSTCRCVFKAVQ